MTPTDGRARESTGARPAYDPAAERTPGARGAAPGVSLGGPSLAVPPVAGEGGYTSPHGQDRERAGLAGMPDPETGAADPATQTAAPVRGRAPRAPVTAGPGGTPASGPPAVTGPSRDRAGRTFTITLPAGLKMINLNERLHWAEERRRAREIKKAAWATALNGKIPRLGRVTVTAEYQPPDRRHRDGDNYAKAAKHAVDGLVAAGCLPGDDRRYVAGTYCTIGEPYPKGRLVLRLTEVPALIGNHPAGRLLAPEPPEGAA